MVLIQIVILMVWIAIILVFLRKLKRAKAAEDPSTKLYGILSETRWTARSAPSSRCIASLHIFSHTQY
jgi:hypothetical protein